MFDAGSIEAKATLDRTPLTEGLRAARAEAQAFERNPIQMRINADLTAANARLAAFRERVDRMNLRARVRVDIDTNNVEARLARIAGQLGQDVPRAASQADRGLGNVNRRMDESSRMAARANVQFSLLRTSIELLGPGIIPIAAGLGGLTTAAVGFGVAGFAAFKDVKSQIAEGTRLGAQWNVGLQTGKQILSTFISGSSVNTLSGFDRALASVQTRLPSLNGLLGTSGRILGDVVAKGVDGVLGGLQTFTPLIIKAEGYVDQFAGAFDHWANGSGGRKFMTFLGDEMDRIVPLLQSLGTLAVRFIQGLAPAGNQTINFLTTFSTLLNHIPVGVLQAATTAYIAFRTAVAVTAGFRAATLALREFAGAEAAAAASSTAAAGAAGAAGLGAGAAGGAALARLRAAGGSAEAAAAAAAASSTFGASVRASAGAMATFVSRAIPYIAIYAGLTYAASTAASHFDDLNSTLDTTHAYLGSVTHEARDLLTFNFRAIGPDASLYGQARQRAAYQAQQQSDIDTTGSVPGAAQFAANGGFISGVTNFGGVAQTRGTFTQILQANGQRRALISQISASYAQMNAAEARLMADRRRAAAGTLADSDQVIADDKRQLARYRNQWYDGQQAVIMLSQLREIATRQNREIHAASDAIADPVRQRNNAQLSIGIGNSQNFAQSSQFLTDYQNGIAKAITAEKSWTAVTDSNTVTIRGNQYEMKAWQAALTQSGGSVARAEGILLGHTRALAEDERAQARAAAEQARITGAYVEASTRLHLTTEQLDLFAAAAGVTQRQLATGRVSAAVFSHEMHEVQLAVSGGNSAMTDWVAAIGQFNQAGDSAASRAQLLSSAMVALQGDTLSYANQMVQAATANQQFVTDFNQMHSSAINLGKGLLDVHNAAAGPVLADLAQLQSAAANAAGATFEHERSLVGVKQAAKDAAAVFKNDTTNELVKEARQLGLTHDQAQKLADRYFHWPKNASTLIRQLGGDKVQTALAGILQDLDELTGNHHIDFTSNADVIRTQVHQLRMELHHGDLGPGIVGVNAAGQLNVSSGGGHGHVAAGSQSVYGGKVPPNTVATVGEVGWEGLVTDAAGRASIIEHSAAMRFYGLPDKIPGYASGTGEQGGFTGVVGAGGGGGGGSGSGSGSGAAHKNTKLMSVITGAGFHGHAAEVAYAIAMAESGGNARAHNPNPPDNSYGLFQVNMIGDLGPARRREFGLGSNNDLYNPSVNARVAYVLSGGGHNFGPWTTFTSGAYRQYMGESGANVRNAPANSGTATTTGASVSQAYESYNTNQMHAFHGRLYQGTQALHTAQAAAMSRTHPGAVTHSGKDPNYDAYGFGGQGYETRAEAVNAQTDYNRHAERGALSAHGALGRARQNSSASGLETILHNLGSVITLGKPATELHEATKKLTGLLTKRDQTYETLIKDRQLATDALNARNAYRSQVQQSYTGMFDITSAGNGYAAGIAYTLHQDVGNAAHYRDLIQRAQRMHLRGDLVRSFIEQPGGMANLEAIVNAGQGYIDSINRDYGSLSAIGAQIGAIGSANAGLDKNYATALASLHTATVAHTRAINAVHTELVSVRRLVNTLVTDFKRQPETKRKGKKT
jgi:Lysozyme like domain